MPRRRSQTTKSGRLRSSVKRRMLNGAEPGAVVVFRKSKKATTSRGRFTGRGAGLVELGLKFHDDLSFDGDCRKLVRYIQVDLAAHYSESLLAGVDPDTGQALPKLSARTTALSKGRSGGFGVRTGNTAKTWQVGTISGHALAARGKVFPSTDPAVRRLFNMWMDRPTPVDLQSVDGKALVVVTAAIDRWTNDAIGNGVATPSRADVTPGPFASKMK